MGEDDVKRLLAEATQGPWRAVRKPEIGAGCDDNYSVWVNTDDQDKYTDIAWLVDTYRGNEKNNAALIAAAPTIAAAYIEQAATIARLTEERDRLREALRKYGRHVERCGVVGECVCGLDAALGKEG